MVADWMQVEWFGWRAILVGIIMWIVLLGFLQSRGYLDRWNATRALGFILMIRTQKGKASLERVSKYRRFWRGYGEVSLWICRLSMAVVFLLILFTFVVALLFPPNVDPPTASELIAIPGLNPVIPLGWGVLAFIVCLVIHEFGHGLQARAHGMRIRSFGLLLLGPLPLGAFAEPEYDELMRAPSRERQRLFAAGPATNLFAGFICLLLLGSVGTQIAAGQAGVHSSGIVENSGADLAEMKPYDIIVAINETQISDLNSFSEEIATYSAGDTIQLTVIRSGFDDEVRLNATLSDKHEYFLKEGHTNSSLEQSGIEVGDPFLGVVGLSEGTYAIDRLTGPFTKNNQAGIIERALYLPIHVVNLLVIPFEYKGNAMHPAQEEMLVADGGIGTFVGLGVLLFIVNLLFWMIWVNLLLGFTNLIPMVPFDGGHLFRDMVHDFTRGLNKIGRKMKLWNWHPIKLQNFAHKTSAWSSLVFLFLLLFTIIAPYFG